MKGIKGKSKFVDFSTAVEMTVRGFSLVELMVTVAIIAIVSGTAYVGLGSFRESLVVQQSVEVVKDTLYMVEQEIVRDEWESATIYFDEDYLRIYAEPEDASLNLDFDPGCPQDVGVVSTDLGELQKKNEKVTVKILNFNNDSDCGNFMASKDLVWEWQMFYEGEESPNVRYFHYNKNRESTGDLSITTGADSYMVIEGPYVSKKYYNSVGVEQTNLNLTLTDGDNEEDFEL